MDYELDPDLRLHLRLSVGSWRTGFVSAALWSAMFAAAASGLLVVAPAATRSTGPAAALVRGAEAVALLLLVYAPGRAMMRLLDLERGGLLDQTRLCARPPSRVLRAALIGSVAPYFAAACPLLLICVVADGSPWSAMFASVAFCAALDIALFAYGVLPADLALVSQFSAPIVMAFALVSLTLFASPAWVQRRAFPDPSGVVSVLLVVAAMPAASRMARRRLLRPPQTGADQRRVAAVWSRLIPRDAPPELVRQLRVASGSRGTPVVMVLAPAVVFVSALVVAPQRGSSSAFVFALVPYFVVLAGSLAVGMIMRRKLDGDVLELVRLTPQRPLAIVASWYGAVLVALSAAVALTVAALSLGAGDAVEVAWPMLVACGAALPALSIAESLSDRPAGTYAYELTLVLLIAVSYAAARHDEGGRLLITHAISLWLAAIVVVWSLTVAASRVGQSDEAVLSGAMVWMAVTAVAAAVAAFTPSSALPRLLPAMLVVVASSFASERERPSPSRGRIANAAIASMVVILIATRLAGVGWMSSGAGALAVAAGILIHELTWPAAWLSFAIRLVIAAALIPVWVSGGGLTGNLPRVDALAPPEPRVLDLIALASACAIVMTIGRRRRVSAHEGVTG